MKLTTVLSVGFATTGIIVGTAIIWELDQIRLASANSAEVDLKPIEEKLDYLGDCAKAQNDKLDAQYDELDQIQQQTEQNALPYVRPPTTALPSVLSSTGPATRPCN
ncbi:MAG: hypothetical protein WAW96_04235 [Alphaproteobacteria bacterium]